MQRCVGKCAPKQRLSRCKARKCEGMSSCTTMLCNTGSKARRNETFTIPSKRLSQHGLERLICQVGCTARHHFETFDASAFVSIKQNGQMLTHQTCAKHTGKASKASKQKGQTITHQTFEKHTRKASNASKQKGQALTHQTFPKQVNQGQKSKQSKQTMQSK
jgi:hypothetical protein